MKRAKLPIEMIEWYDHLVRNRLVSTELFGEHICRIPGRGTPQGGVLSPLIWNLVAQEVLDMFNKGPINPTGFADDICITATSIDPQTLADILQAAVEKVLSWGQRVGLNFNPSKTEFITVSYGNKLIVPPVKINNVIIQPSGTVNYLGITIDSKLNWRANIKNKRSKAIKAINALKPLVNKTWGLRPERVIWLIEAVVSPMVTHGSLVWARPDKMGALRILCEHLYRPLLMGIGSFFKTTPTSGIMAVLNIKPLEIQACSLAVKARLRTRETLTEFWSGVGTLGRGHHKALDNILEHHINKDEIDLWANKLWESLWSESGYRQTKSILPKIEYNKNFDLRKISRGNLRIVMGFFTGHFSFNKHLFQMKLVDTEECRFCMEEDEDAHHLLMECPALEYVRRMHSEQELQTFTPDWYKVLIDRCITLGQLMMRDED
jgi:hypothetical protein